MSTDPRAQLGELLERYNQAFYQRDLEALRALYVSDGEVPYFDNHAGCDSPDLADHLCKVAAFLAGGEVEPLAIEGVRFFVHGDAGCVVATVRYTGRPAPRVRGSFFVERRGQAWKIRHVHFSDDPNDAGAGAQAPSPG